MVRNAREQQADKNGAIELAGVTITHPDKLLWGEVEWDDDDARVQRMESPGDGDRVRGIRKIDLARYYERVAEHMLRFVADRPLTLVRCPSGLMEGSSCLYQKHPGDDGAPPELELVKIMDKGGPATYMYARTPAALVALAQMGVLEVHTWNSTASAPERPDQIVFDLDPGEGVTWERIIISARMLRDALGVLGLASYPKTTGGKGLHVVVPIKPNVSHEDARVFAHAVVERLVATDPSAFTSNMSKAARDGKIFVDYLRNAHGATAVAAFSTRARPGVTVAVPVAWDELDEGLDPASFDTTTVPERLLAQGSADPWAAFELERSDLTETLFRALGVSRKA